MGNHDIMQPESVQERTWNLEHPNFWLPKCQSAAPIWEADPGCNRPFLQHTGSNSAQHPWNWSREDMKTDGILSEKCKTEAPIQPDPRQSGIFTQEPSFRVCIQKVWLSPSADTAALALTQLGWTHCANAHMLAGHKPPLLWKQWRS